MLGNLDFGPEVTSAVRTALAEIAGVVHQLGIQDVDAVKSWFTNMAFVSKTRYPDWTGQRRGALTRGLNSVREDLRQALSRPNLSGQDTQDAAIRILVRSSRPSANKHNDTKGSEESLMMFVKGPFDKCQRILVHDGRYSGSKCV